jgi:hypothetical protein
MSETGRIKLSDEITIEVVDPNNVVPVFADMVTELRFVDDVVYLSLANVIFEGIETVSRKAVVCARLRIRGHTMRFIQKRLEAPQGEVPPGVQTIN